MAQIIGMPRDDNLVGTSVTNSPWARDDIFGLGGADRIDGRSGPILVVLPMIVHGIGMFLTLYASPSFRSGLP